MHRLTLSLLALSLLPVSGADALNHKWTAEAPGAVKWSRMTLAGTYVFATGKALCAIDSASGKLLWSRPEFASVLEFNVEEVPGLPLLFVAQNSGRFSNSSQLTALHLETGQNVWQTEKLKGHLIDLVGHAPAGLVVAFSKEVGAAAKSALDYSAYDLANGAEIFQGRINDQADLYPNEKTSKMMPRFDLNGHAQPAFDDTAMYVAYSGLHKIDLASGKLLWGSKFDVTEGSFKKTNSSPVLAGGTVYSSAKGVIRAFDRNSGALKWTSKDFGASVPEITVSGGAVIARMGGTYFNAGSREYELKKPLGIVALDAASGQLRWRYDDAKDSTTNMYFHEPSKTVIIADSRSLVGLDVTASGKPREAFRVPLEFKARSSGGKKAAKMAGKFALGGIRGMAAKDSSGEDYPLALVPRSGGSLVVRAKQHLLAFDPAARKVLWGVEYKAPGLSGWQKIATTAAFAMAYYMNTSTALNTYAGTTANTTANNLRQQNVQGMFGAWSKSFSASLSSNNYAYMLTDVEAPKGTAPGIVGVNLDSGETEREVLFGEKEPSYVVDELRGVVIRTRKDKEFVADALR